MWSTWSSSPAIRHCLSDETADAESIRASKAELPPIGSVITKLRRQDPYIQQEQHRYRSPRGFQHWANHLAFAAMIEATLQSSMSWKIRLASGLLPPATGPGLGRRRPVSFRSVSHISAGTASPLPTPCWEF